MTVSARQNRSFFYKKERLKLLDQFYFSYCPAFYTLTVLYGQIWQTILSRFAVGGGRVLRWYWVNFQCRVVLLVWILVRARACCACRRWVSGLFGHFFSRLSFLFLLLLSWGTTRYRLKYCLKGPLNPYQSTNQRFAVFIFNIFSPTFFQLHIKR